MLDNVHALQREQTPFTPFVVTRKASITVVGLGYVGAVSCGCLASLGHQIVGVDLDERKTRMIGAGASPIHEQDLDTLLDAGVRDGFISTTSDLEGAVRDTDVTFLSVGTPTAADGGCDYSAIRAAAKTMGTALRQTDGFHVVVMRCSIPPGTTMSVMAPILEETSGRVAGVDFGIAFVPEFLREGVAVADFHNPPKTVIGATDDRTAAIVSRIFDPIDAHPIVTQIETAEMVKYVDNVWHALKVCFANEVGRLSKSMNVDGRAVMDVFVQDTKLNLSPYYLKPGFAYGGSCLPKEVRAFSHLADAHGVDLPLIDSLQSSNEAQIAEAVRLIRQTGARKVGILGLAFKAGTDDLRESPILEVIARLTDLGVKVVAHDPVITRDTNIQGQLSYVAHGSAGLKRVVDDLPDMIRDTANDVMSEVDAVIVTQRNEAYRGHLSASPVPVVDVVQIFDGAPEAQRYQGIGW